MNESKSVMPKQWEFDGTRERVAVREWPNPKPRYVAVLSHGAAEHIGRYDHVAEALVRHGAAVFGPDHLGHGRSAGVRMLIRDFEDVVGDLHSVAARGVAQHPALPLVLIGHSMGGMIAARFAQRYGGELSALVLSGPVIGPWPLPGMLLAMDPFPEIPIDPAVLSRDLEVGRAYAQDPLVWHGALTRESLEATVRCLAAIDGGPSLGALPALWVHGSEDALVPVEVARQGVSKLFGPALASRVYEGARHEVFNEINKGEVLDDVMTFIDSALANK